MGLWQGRTHGGVLGVQTPPEMFGFSMVIYLFYFNVNIILWSLIDGYDITMCL